MDVLDRENGGLFAPVDQARRRVVGVHVLLQPGREVGYGECTHPAVYIRPGDGAYCTECGQKVA